MLINSVENCIHIFPILTLYPMHVRQMWIAKVKLTRAKWSGPSESSAVSSAHFKEDDFIYRQ